MILVRRKVVLQQAWQHGGADYVTPRWVRSRLQREPDGLYLLRRSGKQRLEHGDWLIRNLDGDPTWSTNESLHREYEVIETKE